MIRDADTRPLRSGFPPSRRVLRKSDFEIAYRDGRRLGNACFSLIVCPGSGRGPRLGLSIGARVIGNAVARNKLRRIIRESFRHAQHRLPAVDLIVGARAAAREAPATRIRESLEALWQKVATTCAPSSGP
ncbi:MAG: ribonuclease P protein component [Gammaproteobacteria bacterium]|nr:ribonuclease P protein component [Gammaproteobacteria bacterium]